MQGCESEGGSGLMAELSETHKSTTSPQQTKSVVSFQEVSLVQETSPHTSPQQTPNTVSSQKPSLAQENIPLLTEIEEVTLVGSVSEGTDFGQKKNLNQRVYWFMV